MKTLHTIFWFSLVIIAIAKLEQHQNSNIARHVPEQYQTDVLQIEQALDKNDDDSAMLLISELLEKLATSAPQLQVDLLKQQAQIYQSRFHYHHAIASLNQASQLQPDTSYYNKKIKRLQAKIDSQQQEREMYDVYRDSRHSGIAA